MNEMSMSKATSLVVTLGDNEDDEEDVDRATKLRPRSCVTHSAFFKKLLKGSFDEYIMNHLPRNEARSRLPTDTRGLLTAAGGTVDDALAFAKSPTTREKVETVKRQTNFIRFALFRFS